CISYSFTSPRTLERLRLGDAPVLRLENPLGEEHSVMRPLLLSGLLDAARHNAAHGRPDVALFESAHVYLQNDAAPSHLSVAGQQQDGTVRAGAAFPNGATPAREPYHLGVLLTEAARAGWRSEPRTADFFAARALLEASMEAAGVKWHAVDGSRPFLHPGRAASVVASGGREIGWLGELHPLLVREWEVPGPVAAFEVDVDAIVELAAGRAETYSDVTSFPAVLQDIAVVVAEDVPAARVEEVVRAGGGDLLRSLRVFDLYRGEQVGEGRKSLALRLEFRASDRTLTDEEVAERRAAIERELAGIGGRLRA
ncbi:MAG TPA: hypothetical protein VHF45_10190, partial [Thermoleophilaceae bacterium]|nr:hypothetical protein [Thermoleophilaceae bacterium]